MFCDSTFGHAATMKVKPRCKTILYGATFQDVMLNICVIFCRNCSIHVEHRWWRLKKQNDCPTRDLWNNTRFLCHRFNGLRPNSRQAPMNIKTHFTKYHFKLETRSPLALNVVLRLPVCRQQRRCIFEHVVSTQCTVWGFSFWNDNPQVCAVGADRLPEERSLERHSVPLPSLPLQ